MEVNILASESNSNDDELKQDFTYNKNKNKKGWLSPKYLKWIFFHQRAPEIFVIMDIYGYTVPVKSFAKSGWFMRQWLANFTHSRRIGT